MGERNRWMTELLMLLRRREITLRADTIKTEFPGKMNIEFYIEGHQGREKRK